MRNILSAGLLLSILLAGSFTRGQPDDIVAYYMLLPDNLFFKTMEGYEGQEGRRKLLAPTGTREVVIDRPRAYIQIKDSGVQLTLRYLSEAKKRRSGIHTISQKALKAIAAAPDIEFAYPTYRIYRRGEEGEGSV